MVQAAAPILKLVSVAIERPLAPGTLKAAVRLAVDFL